METITYQNISISGVTYNKLLTLSIQHEVNEHAYAYVTCEVDTKKGTEELKRMNAETLVQITTSAKGQKSKLFCGSIYESEIQTLTEYSVLKLVLISTSHKLDIGKRNRTFQNTSQSFGSVLKKVVAKVGTVSVNVSDRAIGNFLIQSNETDWSFLKKIASLMNTSIYVGVAQAGFPVLQFGIPSGREAQPVASPKVTQSEGSVCIDTEQYGYIGEKIRVNHGNYVIRGIQSELKNGILKSCYKVQAPQRLVKQTPVYLPKNSGKMYLGSVQAVKNNMVQVHFHEMDQQYDSGGSTWLPYSTSYSSGDGSGFYSMPEVGDYVRVFMPSDNEKDAFVASSVNCNPQENTRDKSWKAPGGKEILLTDEGIYIIGTKEKLFINLTKEEGIQIEADTNIEIASEKEVRLKSEDKLEVEASKSIQLSVGSSSVEMKEEKIVLGAKKVYVN